MKIIIRCILALAFFPSFSWSAVVTFESLTVFSEVTYDDTTLSSGGAWTDDNERELRSEQEIIKSNDVNNPSLVLPPEIKTVNSSYRQHYDLFLAQGEFGGGIGNDIFLVGRGGHDLDDVGKKGMCRFVMDVNCDEGTGKSTIELTFSVSDTVGVDFSSRGTVFSGRLDFWEEWIIQGQGVSYDLAGVDKQMTHLLAGQYTMTYSFLTYGNFNHPDLGGGSATGDMRFSFFNADLVHAHSVPETGSLPLLITGLFVFLFIRRKNINHSK